MRCRIAAHMITSEVFARWFWSTPLVFLHSHYSLHISEAELRMHYKPCFKVARDLLGRLFFPWTRTGRDLTSKNIDIASTLSNVISFRPAPGGAIGRLLGRILTAIPNFESSQQFSYTVLVASCTWYWRGGYGCSQVLLVTVNSLPLCIA